MSLVAFVFIGIHIFNFFCRVVVRCPFLLHLLRIHLLRLALHAKPATSPKWPGATKERKPEKDKTGDV